MDQGEFNQLLDDTRHLVKDILIPLEEEVAATDTIPKVVIEQFKKYGLFGLTIPKQYGGLGASVSQEVLVLEELGEASPAFASIIGTNHGIGSQSLVLKGSEKQKAYYLPKLSSGEIISSFCLTEENAGSDAAGVETTALYTNGGWKINGKKRYITNAPEAGLFTVAAKTVKEDMQATEVMSLFLVEANNPRITIGIPDRKMGHRGSHTAEVFFNECFVPFDAILGSVGSGFKTIMKVLDRGRLHVAALSVGIAKRLIEESVRHARNRRQFGKLISDFQLIKSILAENVVEQYAAFCMVKETAARLDAGNVCGYESSSCKLFCTEMVGRVADRAVQIHGGSGYLSDSSVERFYRDVRLLRIYEGTNELQKLIICHAMLKQY